jgi:cytochrome c biogenesis protein CcmG/thiol:disulfide interchange protein DsbE
MKIRSIVLIVLGLSLVAAACSTSDGSTGSPQTAVAAGTDPAAPATVIARFDGSPATLSDYAGSPVVVNFWASWCPSCVAELGAALQPAYEAVGDEIAFLGVNIQDERDTALELIEETGVSFDLAVDPDGDLYLAFEAIGMPFTALVDADGRVVARHNGPLTEAQLLDMIEEAFST